MKKNIGVIFGSRSCEHDVSIITGLQAAQNMDSAKYDVTRIYIDKHGEWYIGEELDKMTFFIDFDPAKVQHVLPVSRDGKLLLIEYPTGKKRLFGADVNILETVDVVMPALHGLNGEDGSLQGMLDMLNVPYTSCGILGCAVGMDKITMKQVFRGCGFPVLPDINITRDSWHEDREAVLDRAEAALPYPMFVKPANLGSSIGISRADNRESLAHAIDVAVAYDKRILIEKGVSQIKEVNCSALGYGDDVRISETEMPMKWSDAEFLDFVQKYMGNGGGKGMQSVKRNMPAPISDELTAQVKSLTRQIFMALDCKGVVRIDYIIDESDNSLYVGEINTIPGSLSFYLWEPVGISFPMLLDNMVQYALKAWKDRNNSTYSFESGILKKVHDGAKMAKGGR